MCMNAMDSTWNVPIRKGIIRFAVVASVAKAYCPGQGNNFIMCLDASLNSRVAQLFCLLLRTSALKTVF